MSIPRNTSVSGRIRTVICLTISLAVTGCSQGDRPALGVVTGKVTLEGEPLPNVEIAFVPKVGRPSYGETDADGNYDLIYIRDIPGAKVGEHTVVVRSGKVDPDQLEPVEVLAGKNVIDIECHRRTKGPTKAAHADDEDS